MDNNSYFNESNGTTIDNEKKADRNVVFQENKSEINTFLGDNEPYREELKILKKHIEIKRIKNIDNGK